MPNSPPYRFTLQGGLSLVRPERDRAAGTCRVLDNYYCVPAGGYEAAKGYERLDGRTAPHSATYVAIAFDQGTDALVADAVVAGGTSAAAGVILADPVITDGLLLDGTGVGTLLVYVTSGTFVDAENLEISAVVAAVATSAPAAGAASIANHATNLSLAQEAARAQIEKVPGSGAVLGVFSFNGERFAFRNNAGGTATVLHRATASGWTAVTTPSLLPDGRYEFIIENFKGNTGARRVYGVDGVNKGFEFDGTTYTAITTGMSPDAPVHLASFQKHLFYSFPNGSVQNSPIADPTATWTPVLGASEIGAGQDVTGFALLAAGDVDQALLAVLCTSEIHLLRGASSASWQFAVWSRSTGAQPFSLGQVLNQSFVMYESGITRIEQTQGASDFQANDIAWDVAPIVSSIRSSGVVGAFLLPRLNQYVLCSSQRAICIGLGDSNQIIGMSALRFRHSMSCFWSGEDPGGSKIILAGGQDGYVYEIDVGASADDLELQTSMTINDIAPAPGYITRLHRMIPQLTAAPQSEFSIWRYFDFRHPNRAAPPSDSFMAGSAGGIMGEGIWGAFVWGGNSAPQTKIPFHGRGETFSFTLRTESRRQAPHTISGGRMPHATRARAVTE